jgi:hypothetical protein
MTSTQSSLVSRTRVLTVAYRSDDCQQVEVLMRERDSLTLKNNAGTR